MAGGIVQTAVFKHVKVANASKVMILLRKQISINVKQDKPEGKAEVQKELEEGLEVLIQNNIDLIIVEVVATNLSFHHSKTIDHKKNMINRSLGALRALTSSS